MENGSAHQKDEGEDSNSQDGGSNDDVVVEKVEVNGKEQAPPKKKTRRGKRKPKSSKPSAEQVSFLDVFIEQLNWKKPWSGFRKNFQSRKKTLDSDCSINVTYSGCARTEASSAQVGWQKIANSSAQPEEVTEAGRAGGTRVRARRGPRAPRVEEVRAAYGPGRLHLGEGPLPLRRGLSQHIPRRQPQLCQIFADGPMRSEDEDSEGSLSEGFFCTAPRLHEIHVCLQDIEMGAGMEFSSAIRL